MHHARLNTENTTSHEDVELPVQTDESIALDRALNCDLPGQAIDLLQRLAWEFGEAVVLQGVIVPRTVDHDDSNDGQILKTPPRKNQSERLPPHISTSTSA